MVINRDKHNKFFTIVDNTKPQGTTDNQGQSSGDNSNTGSSSGSAGGNTTIIYQGGGMTENQTNKLNGIEEGAEKNQDAFSYITIQGATSEEDVTLSADNPTDTLRLAAEGTITLSLEDDVITISCNGVGYLKELLDVAAENPLNGDSLIYNSETEKWEATSSQFATVEWVNEQFDNIIGSAPEVLDTIYEIAEALDNNPDYVKDIANNLSALTNSVTTTEQDIIDIKSKLLPTNFTNLTSGQLLQYDGQYWVNVDKSSSEIDENWLLEYLTTNNYVKKSDITWSNLIGKPSVYATDIASITDLNSSWDNLLTNAPTDYITRWPSWDEVTDKPVLADAVTGNAGSATQGVYVSGNEVKAMTYSLHANVNSGLTSRLAVYNTDTAISYMNTTVGSQSKPVFISSGVPTVCTELNTITYYGKYFINSREATYSTIRHNHPFITSIVRQAEGQLLMSIDVPGSMALNYIFIWGAGQYTHIDTNADSGCYISIYYVNSYQIRVTVHDDASANDGYFYLHFLAIG